ncbi:M56 family metallopeptidase [Parabacteroides sp. PF5-6]|uniref:M56 family metallopeptidase n=1 Tax=Parabacteroides sp. PF5-6 TaxID=1742403 RepID=UPI002406EC67|nr:M56 family metallopeptidase [Parabacteroides sp. PF5-6]
MSPELAYFLKVNVAFAFFYAFYRLLFYKDTFFKLRRAILLAFFGLAMVYPLFNMQEWVREQEPIAEVIYYYSLLITPEVEAAEAAGPDWISILGTGLGLTYIAGILGLTIRFFVQLGSIIWLARRSKKIMIGDVQVFALDKPAGPFSFFRWIFIHPGSHSEKETDEILTHECTHVSQWHSIDVIISEFITITCWFNPFTWLLKREVRHNLEYLADNTVLESGYDSRSYQYHLLGLAHHKGSTHLYNSFNVLHLKNRIGMMNKKRSRGIGRTKYLMFVPLVLLLMIVSNIEAVARITKNVARDITPPLLQAIENISPLYTLKETETPVTASVEEEVEEEVTSEVFTVVEKMPRFPGGDAVLLKHLSKNLVYPRDAASARIEGRVVVSFVVRKDGSVTDPVVVRGIHHSLDAEAIRVVGDMPKWEPGTQRGKPVNVKYTVPVQFRLPAEEQAEGHVFTVVEQMPRFPGGEAALLKYISSQIKYPVRAQEEGIQGRVVASMVVDADGNIKDIEVIRGIDPDLDREAKRVISLLPKWQPGEQRGRKVSVKYTIPIQFRLQ